VMPGAGVADLGRWFKLWCSSVRDPDLDNLSVADFGRWAKLGAIIKEQGTDGKITFQSPARSACSALQVDSISDLAECISRFPNVRVSSVTSADVSLTVEYANWRKYQGDFSTDRVHKFRAKNDSMKRSKRRGEEKRVSSPKTSDVEHPRSTESPPASPNGFVDWPEEWKKLAEFLVTEQPFARLAPGLCKLAWWQAEDARLEGTGLFLLPLLQDCVRYWLVKGYAPRTAAGLRAKVGNAISFHLEASENARAKGRPYHLERGV